MRARAWKLIRRYARAVCPENGVDRRGRSLRMLLAGELAEQRLGMASHRERGAQTKRLTRAIVAQGAVGMR